MIRQDWQKVADEAVARIAKDEARLEAEAQAKMKDGSTVYDTALAQDDSYGKV